jgi:hypothetical protein
MISNARQSRFRFNFNKGFIFESIEKKWEQYIRASMSPYKTVNDFINSQIQTVTFPGIQLSTAEQTVLAEKRYYKPSWEAQMLLNRDFNVTMKLTESYTNYFIMFDQLAWYLDDDAVMASGQPHVHFDPFYMDILDHLGFVTTRIKMTNIVYSGISGLDFSYSSDNPQFKTFTCNFKFSRLELDNPDV